MGFIGVYRALFDYSPQAENELAISEGDILFILEKGDDGWWKAKKKGVDEDEQEPEGLIPGNYIEEATPLNQAKALYDYSRQTDEELSFTEEAKLNVYDTSDPDWTLCGLSNEYGFVPSNYIEILDSAPVLPARSHAETATSANDKSSRPTSIQPQGPAAALAGIIQQGNGPLSPTNNRAVTSPTSYSTRPQQFTPDASDDEGPPPTLPQRPQSQSLSPNHSRGASTAGAMASPDTVRETYGDDENGNAALSTAGYHIYNGYEMVEHMGKNMKMPTTLGINLMKGVIMIAPEQSRDGPQREWTAEKLSHYSIEGKHVFLELIRPSKSVDFHGGTKDTAQEIVAYLGELAGGARMAGLREVLAVGSGSANAQKQGRMLYEFMAQADDEVTVATGDDVIILDDTRSDEWWVVRRVKNGKEGTVPSSYVEVTGTSTLPPNTSLANSGLSTVEQNRLDEEQRTREAVLAGPSIPLPDRQSSLGQTGSEKKRSSHKSKNSRSSRSRPQSTRVRTWTDRTGTFKVEAEFLGLKDNKIHLHKLNGVKIAVPVSKMSVEDIDYVEGATGLSLDEDKPLSDIKRRNTQKNNQRGTEDDGMNAIASVKTPKYDWFDFFLACGVNPQICERYASAFSKDEMGEENLPDISSALLRNLGLKEGDILRVMKHLDTKFNRVRSTSANGTESTEYSGTNGGLFSGPGGALKNNTRKGRPAPAVQTSDTVDGKVFEGIEDRNPSSVPSDARATPLTSAPTRPERPTATSKGGFDDDAWDVKPSKQDTVAAAVPALATQKPLPLPTGALAELSLLSPPLQPTPATQVPSSQPEQSTKPLQQAGASAAFFNQLVAPAPGTQQNQSTGINPLQAQITARPGPQLAQSLSPNSLVPPPPLRPLSAPQNFNQPSAFGPPPLQPQLTGYLPQQQSQIAPQGQSLAELNQRRLLQQNYPLQMLQYQSTGFNQSAFGQGANGLQPQLTSYTQFAQQPQPTGFQTFQPQLQPQFINGQQQSSPFADPLKSQHTAFQPTQGFLGPQQQQQQPLQPQQTSINTFLPAPLVPQRTAAAGGLGFNGAPSPFGGQTNGFGPLTQNSPGFPHPPPPTPQDRTPIAPLIPQKTGPAPPVRFGVQGPTAQKLVPQPTGRANLMNATPQNPFGF